MAMPTIYKILPTTALCLAATACASCYQTRENALGTEGCYLTYTHAYPSSTSRPVVYRLNEEESLDLMKLAALIQPDTPYLDLLPESGLPLFIVCRSHGEVKYLDFFRYYVSIPELFAKVDALVKKIKSRPGAQLQGEELRNWNNQTHDHS